MNLLFSFVILVLGFVLLVKGADFFVESASGIAARFGIPQLVIGLTIVAMGTSLPEAAVSITAALQGSGGISIGNVIGSNIMNVLLILGATAVICAVPVQLSTVKYEIPFMLVISVALLIFGLSDNQIVRFEGVVLWGFFIVYLAYLFRMAKNGTNEDEDIVERPLPIQILLLIGGAAAIVIGSNLTVDGATEIATFFGMDDRLIGLTIVAFGTSLPELVTSVTAARKGKTDIAIGNIVGSNVFNILFVTGTTALITPVVFKQQFLIDAVVAIAAGILLWLGVVKTKKLTRPTGIVMLLAYAVYFGYLLMY